MTSVTASRRADLTDEQWAAIEPLLPVGKKSGRPPKWMKRQLIDGIRWRTRVGAPWRDVPERYGPWQSVYGLFRSWQRSGAWEAILSALQICAEAAGDIVWDVSVDSTIARGAPHAAGGGLMGVWVAHPRGGGVWGQPLYVGGALAGGGAPKR
ncbi:transposase, partial [Nocardia sp. NPDC058497]|uniref:transposase n=1 Tax=Nocardia sp. NPDC058497 TaxID=3346529 RepID=UPI0036670FF0